MWPQSFFPNSFFPRSFWEKVGATGAVPPISTNRQYLPILGIGAFLLFAVFLAGAAHGHGDAAWIAEGKFTGDDGVHCCGTADCERVPRDAVRRVKTGWLIVETGQLFKDGQPGLYEGDSIDDAMWWCVKLGATPPHKRCLLTPPAGV